MPWTPEQKRLNRKPDPRSKPIVQTLEEAWVELWERDRGLAIKIMITRIMMEQRGIEVKRDLVSLMGRSYTYIYNALTPRVNWDTVPSNTLFTPEKKNAVLDEIDEAINTWTLEHGGFDYVCPYTDDYLDEFNMQMAQSLEIQEMFPDAYRK